MTSTAPALPPRRQDPLDAAGMDEPPPAYEAHPSNSGDTVLAQGPSRPFQPAPVAHPAPPQHPQSTGSSYHYQTNYQPYQPPAQNIGPPQFPFWNGAGLTPEQTGFSEGPVPPVGHPLNPASYNPPPGPPPSHLSQHQSYHSPTTPASPSSQYHPPPGPPPNLPPRPTPPNTGSGYDPTTSPTPGQPLLNNGRLLVYPVGREVCWKCSNTGYKHNDPSHPCRKCWERYGKQYHGALKLAATSSSSPPPNYQKPLRTFQPPAAQVHTGYPGHNGPGWQQQPHHQPGTRPQIVYGPPPVGPNVLVLRPGDPRMGGVLCQKCGGSGVTYGFLFDEDQCSRCRGTGRLF